MTSIATPNIEVATRSRYRMPFLGLALLGGLFIISRYNYLLFHSFAEGFSIFIACSIFVIAWNARSRLENDYLLFIGIAYLSVGMLDFIHTLAYKGMGVFPGYGANPATQLWIAARFIESLSLLAALRFLHRRLRTDVTFAVYGLVVGLLLLAIFRWDIFPDCFVEQEGLTAFKKISEYIISVIFLVTAGLLFSKRKAFDTNVFRLLTGSILVSTGAELTFTIYTDVYGLFNLAGHYLKIISFYLIYRAIIVTGIAKPHEILFRELQESEAFLNSVVMSSLSGLYIYDLKARKNVFINPQYTRITGYSLNDLNAIGGANFFNFFHPEDLEGITAHWDRMMTAADGEIHEIEYRFKTAAGPWIWCFSRDTVFKRSSDGSPLQFLGSFLDITGRKEAERQLKESRDELEKRVRDRTAVLRWRNRELREFAHVASHDLQEPLRKIQTFGNMLERENAKNLPVKSRDYLRRMINAAGQMQSLVQNLLTYSRLTSDTQPYVKTRLTEIARKALQSLELRIKGAGASITIGDLPEIEVDPIQMLQLFQNLIDNALRFHSEDRKPRLSISAISPQTIGGKPAGYCEIRFQDNGIGFDQRYLEQIFKPFKRLHARHEYEGTGMGLSICRRIVERHRGSITATSSPGEGSTFIVRLPLVQRGRSTVSR